MITAIVGAGPPGMLAALDAVTAGSDTILIDEHHAIGGHLRYDPYLPTGAGAPGRAWLEELLRAVEESQVIVRTSTVVWAAYRTGTGFDLMLATPSGPETLQVNSIVIATGTTDTELIVPGSTVPGVLTERAARILIETYGVLPGGRFVVVGGDPARTERLASVLGQGGGSVTTIDTAQVASIGDLAGVTHVALTDQRRLDTDVVVLAIGERPDLQLAGMLDVPRTFDPVHQAWFVDRAAIPDGIRLVGGCLLGPCDSAEMINNALSTRDATGPDGLFRQYDLELTRSAIAANGDHA